MKTVEEVIFCPDMDLSEATVFSMCNRGCDGSWSWKPELVAEAALIDEMLTIEDRDGVLYLVVNGSRSQHGKYTSVKHPSGRKIALHRINFYLMHDYLPNIVDHIRHGLDDAGQLDHGFSNLRAASPIENAWNREMLRPIGDIWKETGKRGVMRFLGRYFVSVHCFGRSFPGGAHDTIEEAVSAYNELGRRMMGKFFVEQEI